MPYIPIMERVPINRTYPDTPGRLAWSITEIIQNFLEHQGEVNFASHAVVLGVLDAVKQEYYRRVVAPYEEHKCAENGDVFRV